MKNKKMNWNNLVTKLVEKSLQVAFPLAETFSTSLATKWAFQLFQTPFRNKFSKRDWTILNDAEQRSIMYRGLSVQTYCWGRKEAPAILLVHGWSGKVTQFFQYIPKLIERGYCVYSFDPPAHGNSEGKYTSMPDYAETILRMNRECANFYAIIGHSMGGSAAFFAVQKGLKTRAIISIGSPTIGQFIYDGIQEKLNLSEKTMAGVRSAVINKFGKDIHEAMPAYAKDAIKKGDIQLLIVHDQEDDEAPIEHAEKLRTLYPNADAIITKGLGHTRILREESVTDQVVGFVEKVLKKERCEDV